MPKTVARIEDRRHINRARSISNAKNLDTLPSEQIEWEAKFCVAAMTWPEEARRECGYLSPEWFLDPKYAKFWELVLGGKDPIESAVDADVLAELATYDAGSPILQARHTICAEQVSDLYYLRTSLARLSEAVQAIAERDAGKVEGIVSSISERRLGGIESLVYPENIHAEFTATIQQIASSGSKAILTHIPNVDNTIGGFYPGEMVIIAARPSMGKTALSLQFARNMVRSGKVVLFLSLEMTGDQLWARMACPMAGLDWTKVRSGNVTKEQLEILEGCSENLASQMGKNLIIVDSLWSIPDIYRVCIAANPDIIFLDQLSEISWYDEGAKEVEWYGKAVRVFKNRIAKRLNVPFVLLHSLNRATELRPDKRPQLADLKWSGDIEQSADMVLMTFRPDYYEKPPRNYQVDPVVPFELWTMKHRQGWLNQCSNLAYDLQQQWFA